MANDIRFELKLSQTEATRLDALVDLERRLYPGRNVSRASVIRTMINELWDSDHRLAVLARRLAEEAGRG